MNPRPAICAFFIFLAASTMYSQEPAGNPAPASQAATDQGKPRDAKETKDKLEDLACGPSNVHHSQRTDKDTQPLPAQPPDKALIYVLRPTHYGGAIQTKLAVDKKWVGVNRENNYFYITLDPGPHYFCSQAENRSLLSLVVEAGKTYYLQQKITMGMMKARNDLEVLNEEEGKKGLAKCKPSILEEKN
jgi:uncharacterized protein DUF2846